MMGLFIVGIVWYVALVLSVLYLAKKPGGIGSNDGGKKVKLIWWKR